MKVIMTGGGTGGHIYPAVAIAEEIRKRDRSAEILFVGTRHGMEKDIVPKAGYPIRFITVSGFHRTKPWKNIQTIRDLRKGNRESAQILKEFQPDLVIGTGGYVCGPIVRAAAKMGIRTFIHEQNAYPGMANQMLARQVERVFVAFEEAKPHLHAKKDPVTTGNPVRRAFAEISGNNARRELGIPEDDFVVLSFGGSLGARCINDEMLKIVRAFRNREHCRIYFVTGRRYYEEIAEILRNEDGGTGENIVLLRYIDDMPKYLNACDLAITRSGALTVSEISACGKASVLIPSPNVTHNHQYHNAKVLADRGAAILIEEKNLTDGGIQELIELLLRDRDALQKMERESAALGTIHAAETICDTIGIPDGVDL